MLLKAHHGDLSDTAPFFQTFDQKTNTFTGLAYIVELLSRVVHSTLTALGAKRQHGRCVHFRVEVANMLYEAGVDKTVDTTTVSWTGRTLIMTGNTDKQDLTCVAWI
jgi:hypothetical protein